MITYDTYRCSDKYFGPAEVLETSALERDFTNTFANLIFVSGKERSGFPETPILLGFGKSYLIPETTNFDIGEGIVYNSQFKPATLGLKLLGFFLKPGFNGKIHVIDAFLLSIIPHIFGDFHGAKLRATHRAKMCLFGGVFR